MLFEANSQNYQKTSNIKVDQTQTLKDIVRDIVHQKSANVRPGDSNAQLSNANNLSPKTYNFIKSREDITIGEDTLTSHKYPIFPYYSYSYSQNIYLASEINKPGLITKIKYYFAGTNLNNSNYWAIYMGSTPKTTFSDYDDNLPIDELTQVYYNHINWSQDSWIDIELETPYAYNGTDNLVIAVNEMSNNANDIEQRFYCSEIEGYRALTWYSPYYPINPTNPRLANNRETFIANVILTIDSPALEHDLMINLFDIPSVTNNNAVVKPKIRIANFGTSEESDYSASLVITDQNNNTVYSETINPNAIQPLQSSFVYFPDWIPSIDGEYKAIATINMSNDQNTDNNSIEKYIQIVTYDYAFGWVQDPFDDPEITQGAVNIALQNGALSQISENQENFVIAADYVLGSLYGVQYQDNGPFPLVRIDENSGQYEVIGGGAQLCVGFTYDVSSSVAYVMDIWGVLYKINLENGAVQQIGGTFMFAIGIACNNEGDLYAISLLDEVAYIDKTTGAHTVIGNLNYNINDFQDIGFDRNKNILYGTLSTGDGGLYTISTTNGAATQLGTFIPNITGLAIPYTYDGANITFKVKNSNNEPVGNALITIGQKQLTTNAQGVAKIYLLCNEYEYNIVRYGYNDANGSFEVINEQDETINVVLTNAPTFNATIKVTNTKNTPIENAEVTLFFNDLIVGSGTTNTQGVFTEALSNGTFSAVIKADGFIETTRYVTINNAPASINVKLTEIIWQPYRLKAKQLNSNGDVLFTWNNYNGFFDDFESYDDFIISDIGNYTLFDGDGSPTYAFNNYTFPNEYYTGSYIIFNPSQASPPLIDNSITPHSGNKFIGCFAAVYSTNNDWLITPEIPVESGLTFSFWAKTLMDYGLEEFKVAVSTTDKDPGSFNFIDLNPVQVPLSWTKYEYDLSAYAGKNIYLAIVCVSNDVFLFMVDDLEVAFDKKSPKPLVNYKISKNGVTIASNITTTNYTLEGLAQGEYTFGVKGIFQTGESAESVMSFTVTDQLDGYTVNYNVVNQNGTLDATLNGIHINSGEEVAAGSDIIFTASPNSGYRVKKWSVNGNTIQGNNTNNFVAENINENILVTVEFEEGSSVADIQSKIEIFPNPSKNIFELRLDGRYKISVTDMCGRVIIRESIVSEQGTIDLTYQPPGIYFIRLVGDITHVVKIIKQ